MMLSRRLTVPAVVVVLGLAGCGAGGKGASTAHAPQPRFDGTTLPAGTRAPQFALHDQDGHAVSLGDQRGRYVIVTFLYTHCPDICPLIASNLGRAVRRLGSGADRVRVLAISVDPRGDTPAAVRRFVRDHALPPQFRYLTGATARLRPIWAAWHVAVDPQHLDAVDHTAYEALIDPQGRERVIYGADVKPDEVVHDLRLLGLAA